MSQIRRAIMASKKPDYIQFEDPIVAQICAENWGDGKGITYEQAAAVKTLGSKFQGNTEIVSFNELRYFTNVNTLGDNSFNGCSSLVELNLDNIKTIGKSVFVGASLVGTINLPSIETIGASAFSGLKNITRVVFGEKAKKFGSRTFQACTGLESIVIPDTITAITDGESRDFSGCSNLVLESLPQNVTIIGYEEFRNCAKLNLKNLGGVKTISQYALYGALLDDDIDMFKVTSINKYALQNTKADNGIEIYAPNLVSAIDTQFTRDSCVRAILGYNRFQGQTNYLASKLELLVIPDTQQTIGAYFMGGVGALKTIVCHSITPLSVAGGNDAVTNKTVYVPQDGFDLYSEHTYWGKSTKLYVIGGPEWVAQFGAKDPRSYLIGTIAERNGHVVVSGEGEDRVVTDTGV